MNVPEIYGDFHKVDDQNCVQLTTVGTCRDLDKHGIQLKENLHVTIYMDDADDEGNPDDLMADAVVHYNDKEKCWVAQIDWSKVQNRSERTKAVAQRPTPDLKNSSLRSSKGKKSIGSRKPTRGGKVRKVTK